MKALGRPFVLLARTVRATRSRGFPWKEFFVQANELGVASTWLIIMGLSFFGTVLVTLAYFQARRYVGNVAVVGPAYFQLMIREFAPLTAALLAAARMGAATSAELASMSVNEQLEAMELSNANVFSELVAPRVAAALLAVPALTVIGTLASVGAAAFTVSVAFDSNGAAFLDGSLVTSLDVAIAVGKALACGLFIPLAASARGLAAQGGAHSVGQAVTDGVVDATLGCLVIDFLFAAGFALVAA